MAISISKIKNALDNSKKIENEELEQIFANTILDIT